MRAEIFYARQNFPPALEYAHAKRRPGRSVFFIFRRNQSSSMQMSSYLSLPIFSSCMAMS